MKIRFIGDVHGKYARYKSIIKTCNNSIQVGDMGVGFKRMHVREDGNPYFPNPPHRLMKAGNHRFIRGNHDNPEVCKRHSQYISDGTYEHENGIMYVGGAASIDANFRVEGYSWWPDEELSVVEFNKIITDYCDIKPNIMITHECPNSILSTIFQGKQIFKESARTRQAFDTMFQYHRPKLWIFGHWHTSACMNILGTLFICLNELEYIDIETDEYMK